MSGNEVSTMAATRRKDGVETSFRKIQMLAVAIVLTVVGVSCSSGPNESLAFDEPVSETVVESEPTVNVDVVESSDVISFQASWMCELQRRTFADLDATDEALDESLFAAGVSRSTYDEFVAMLPQSQELRDEVLSRFTQTCRA